MTPSAMTLNWTTPVIVNMHSRHRKSECGTTNRCTHTLLLLSKRSFSTMSFQPTASDGKSRNGHGHHVYLRTASCNVTLRRKRGPLIYFTFRSLRRLCPTTRGESLLVHTAVLKRHTPQCSLSSFPNIPLFAPRNTYSDKLILL